MRSNANKNVFNLFMYVFKDVLKKYIINIRMYLLKKK